MSVTRKFRGKRKDNGEWVKGFYVESKYYEGGDLYRIIPENVQYCDYEGYYIEYDVDPVTVGQYIGICDINETEIFEGDIIKTHYANAQKADFIETVVFHNGKFCGFYENNGCKQWATLYDGVPHLAIDKSVYMDSVEIIGNIHDNPELLKGGADNE